MKRFLPVLAAAMMAAAVYPVHAASYRWIDANGVVNFGDNPPATGPIKELREQPALQPDTAAPASPQPSGAAGVTAGERESAEQAAFARLRQDQADARQQKVDAARARCEAERGVDCESDAGARAFMDGGYGAGVRPAEGGQFGSAFGPAPGVTPGTPLPGGRRGF